MFRKGTSPGRGSVPREEVSGAGSVLEEEVSMKKKYQEEEVPRRGSVLEEKVYWKRKYPGRRSVQKKELSRKRKCLEEEGYVVYDDVEGEEEAYSRIKNRDGRMPDARISWWKQNPTMSASVSVATLSPSPLS